MKPRDWKVRTFGKEFATLPTHLKPYSNDVHYANDLSFAGVYEPLVMTKAVDRNSSLTLMLLSYQYALKDQ